MVEDYTECGLSGGGLHRVWVEVEDYTECGLSGGGLHRVWVEWWRITSSVG